MERQEQYHRNRHTRVMGKHVLHTDDPGGGVIQA